MAKQDASQEDKPLKRKKYERELRRLQGELCKLQDLVKYKGPRVMVVFEGRDVAGKGGTIRAITERVSPRVFRVVASPAPSDRDKSQMYMQRYIPHFPAAGEIVIFEWGVSVGLIAATIFLFGLGARLVPLLPKEQDG